MIKNFWYLVAAYSAVWVVVCGYLFALLRRNRKLAKTIEEMEARIDEMEKGRL